MGNLAKPLSALRAGEMAFDRFARETKREWRAMAKALYDRWSTPTSVTAEDVEQEMLLAAWQHVEKWDPNRGVTLERYVVYNAHDRAKKWMNVQRDAARRSDKAPSRHALPFTQFETDTGYSPLDSLAAPDDQMRAIDRHDGWRVARRRCTSREERMCVDSLFAACGDIGTAADTLYENADLRYAMRWGSAREAKRFVEWVFARILFMASAERAAA